jgi:hypothetical protein
MSKRININYALTLLLSLFTILQVYYISLGGISLSLASVVLILLLPPCLLGINLSDIKLDYNTLLLFVFLFIHFLLFVLPNNSNNGAIMSTINFLLVLFVLSIIVPNIYDKKLGIQMVISISVVSSVFLIIQFIVLHGFDIYISGQVPFLEYRTSVMGHVRPFSLFSEPSAFGFYNVLGLATVLYCEGMNKKKRILFLAIISFSLLLSLSTTSIGLLVLVWAKWGIPRLKLTKVKISVLFQLSLLLPLFLFLGWRFNIFNTIYQHSIAGLFSGNYAGGLTGRIGNLSYAWQYHSLPLRIFFGVGIVDLDYFIPAFARAYVYYGVFGYFLLGIFFTRVFMTSNEYCRTFILIALASAIFSDSVFGVQMLIYMPLVISYKNRIRRKRLIY